jgi:hypothetical protein
MITVAELIEKLQELPPDWEIYATKSGSSLQAWDPTGVLYAYVFTDDRETKRLVDRRAQARRLRSELKSLKEGAANGTNG